MPDNADILAAALAALAAVKLARKRTPQQIRNVVLILRDNDMHALAKLLIETDRPPYEGMMQ